jgi:hypothetical protein
LKQPLTNAQLEILKAFSHKLSNEELKEFQRTIANFFADRAVEGANKVWDEKGWTKEDEEKMLITKMRKRG